MSRTALRRMAAVAATLLAGTMMAACSSSDDSSKSGGSTGSGTVSYPLTLTDASGQKLTLDKKPTKIGCYWTGCDEVLASLGVVPDSLVVVNAAWRDVVQEMPVLAAVVVALVQLVPVAVGFVAAWTNARGRIPAALVVATAVAGSATR